MTTMTTIMRWVREQRARSAVAKGVLFVVASHADRDGRSKLSYRRIADEAETSEATVRREVTVLIETGLVRRLAVGAGRGTSVYELALPVRRPDDAQDDAPSARSASSRRRTSAARSASSESRSASSGTRSASSRVSDQHKQGPEVLPTGVEELQEEAAPPLSRADAPARTRGGRGEIVPAAELNRTATAGPAYLLVAAWADAQPPGFRLGARRELNKAVDALLAQPHVRPDLIPEALDEAHRNPRWRNPAAVLHLAYDDVWRRHSMPTRDDPVNPHDAYALDFVTRSSGYQPRAIGGPS